MLSSTTPSRVSPSATASRASPPTTSGEDDVTQESESSSVQTQQTGTSSRLLVNEGIEYHKKGKSENALKSFQLALKSQLLNTEGDHPLVANTLSNIGSVYLQMGRLYLAAESLTGALGMLNRLRKLCQTDEEKATVPLAGVLNNLGTVFFLRGEIDRSLEYYRGAINDATSVGGSNKKELANALHNIGRLSCLRKDWATCLDMLIASLRIEEELHGKDDILLVDTLDLIGFAHLSTNSLDDAMVTFAESLSIVHSHCGLVHEKVATALLNVGMVMERQGRLENSLQAFSTAQDVFKRVGLGDEHRGVRAANSSVVRLTRLHQMKKHGESSHFALGGSEVESQRQEQVDVNDRRSKAKSKSPDDSARDSLLNLSSRTSLDIFLQDEDDFDSQGDCEDENNQQLECRDSREDAEYAEYREDPGWEENFSIVDSRDSDSIESIGIHIDRDFI
jgi:tetratricopeptide (TPR) repeat protein